MAGSGKIRYLFFKKKKKVWRNSVPEYNFAKIFKKLMRHWDILVASTEMPDASKMAFGARSSLFLLVD